MVDQFEKAIDDHIAENIDPKCECGAPATTTYDFEPYCKPCKRRDAQRDMEESEIIK